MLITILTRASEDALGDGHGTLTEAAYYVLLSLYEPLHGYGIMQKVVAMSAGRVQLGAGTLYGVLGTLSSRGWIKEVAQYDRKREYQITSDGHLAVISEIARLDELLRNGQSVTADTNFDQWDYPCHGDV